jgi:hypothetical protein
MEYQLFAKEWRRLFPTFANEIQWKKKQKQKQNTAVYIPNK